MKPVVRVLYATNSCAQDRHSIAGIAVLGIALLSPLYSLGADLPTRGRVVQGSGQIGAPATNQMVIDQASNKLTINWQSFDIGAGNKVTFKQPGTDAIALNRVLGADGSKIMGQLDANGRVFLVNPNGVLFGQNAQVNVGALVASTLDISDADFAAGKYHFKGNGSNASIINQGSLNAADGGAIALLGGTVSNQGVIVANRGTVALAAGNAATLDFAGDGLLNVQVDEATVNALAENHQLIKADGGQVLLTASAGNALLKTIVNNTGVIEAQTLGNKEGKIVLLGSADGGNVQVAGTLDASASAGGSGGFVETSGAHVQVADSAKVTTASANSATGTWLIDPTDFTIAASGGDMTGAAVSAAVQSNNFQVQTASSGTGNGDLFVNDALSWTSANTLTLTAGRNININAAISASNGGLNLSAASAISASSAVNVGTFTLTSGAWSQLASALPAFSATDFRLSGGSFLRALGGDGSSATPWRLTDSYGLQGIGTELTGHFSLANAIDASGTANWNCTSGVCAGFAPIGSSSSSNFTGSLDGQGYTISGLLINRSTQDYDGLFGYTGSGSTLSNIALVGGSVTGHYRVGGLVGYNQSSLNNVSTTGAVSSATSSAGGLVGYNKAGSISNAHATGTVASASYAGGLVGYNNAGSISNAYATGAVSTTANYAGGLLGYNYTGTINNAYATGATSGVSDIGGLAGRSESGSLTNVYATGNVTGSTYVAGLVGANTLDTINYAYATGAVSASSQDGGLIGNDYMSSITNSFYATTLKTGQTINAGLDTNNLGIGKTWADLSQSSTFAGWNIGTTGGASTVWRIYNGATTPLLRNFLTPVTVGASINTTYNGTLTGNFTYTTSVPGAVLNGTATYTSTSANAGTYTTAGSSLNLGGLYSGQQGYDIAYANNASLTIGRAPLTITANGASKTYDGTAYFGGNGVTYSGLVNNENSSVLAGTLAYGGTSQGAVNHGNYGISVNGLTSSNYAITFASGSLAIGQAPLTITANDASKTYDGTAYFGGNGVTYSGLVNNENSSVLTGALAYSGSSQGAVNHGTYGISVNGLTSSNYAITFANGSLAIGQAPLTITANDASKTYDGIAYSGGNGVTYSGLVNNENSSVLAGTLAYGGTSQGAVNHGTYGISVNGLTSSNYAITFASGSLAIGQAPLTITANDASKTYDGTAYFGGNGVTYSGLVNNENSSVLTGTLAYGGSAQGAVNEGTYTISASGLSADNYAVTFVDGALGISGQPAPPTIPPITPVTPPTVPTAPTAPTLPTEPTAPAEVQVSVPASYVNVLASLHTGQPAESGGEVPVIGGHVGESIRAMVPGTPSDENGDQGLAPGEHSYKVIASGIRLPEGL